MAVAFGGRERGGCLFFCHLFPSSDVPIFSRGLLGARSLFLSVILSVPGKTPFAVKNESETRSECTTAPFRHFLTPRNVKHGKVCTERTPILFTGKSVN